MALDLSAREWIVRPATAQRGAVVLRPMDPVDAPRLGAAFASMDPWARYPYPAAALARYLAGEEADAPRRAIMTDNRLAGVLGLRLNWLRGPYVQFLGLLPDAQRKGLGSAVLDWLSQTAMAAGERNLWVCASDFNREGIEFYKRHGFAVVATLDGLVRDDRAEILLRKRLFPATSGT